MKLLGKYIRKYAKESILAPVFKMLEALFELLIPVIVARIIDTDIGLGGSAVIKDVILMIVLGLVGFVSAVSAQYFAAKSAACTGADIRSDLFRHINTLSYKEIDSVGTSVLITRMTSDVNQLQNAVNMFLRLFLRAPIIVIGSTAAACIIGKKTNLLFGITVPGLFALVFLILALSMPLNSKVQQVLEKITLSVKENISGARVIRAFGRQNAEAEEFREHSGELYRRQLAFGAVSGLLNPFAYAVINLAIVGIIYIGGGEVYEGVLTRGTVVALVNYMSQILLELIKLANLIIIESRGLASLKRINELFEIKNSLADGDQEICPEEPAAVCFDRVSFSYGENAAPAVSDVSFSILPGQTVGLIGNTGSGKTTLVNLLLRNYEAGEGSITVDGIPVKKIRRSALQSAAAVVPQKAALFSGTLRANLSMGREISDEEAWQALLTAQAKGFVEEKGEGLDLRIEEGGSNLSGGQKQRLTIARALVRNAGLLILDDSSSALDFATEAALRKALKEDPKDRTTIIISQRISSIKDADKIIVMDGGKTAGIGTHSELLSGCPVYREIYETQEGTNG